MKSVYLGYTSSHDEYYVMEQDYQNVIRPMVMKLRICEVCHRYYEPEADPPNPCVGLRICMDCFLRKHPDLRFLEVKSVDEDREATYAFIDAEGNVSTSRENYSDAPQKDISYTLKQHSFSLPERYKPFKATEERRLHSSYFTVYGDLQHASVLVADYNDFYDKQHCAFLLYKHGGYKELTKRGEGKVLLERAEAMLQRTKLPNGYFLIDGVAHSRIWDSDIYKIVSQMETAMYNISMQFALPVSQEQSERKETEEAATEVEDGQEPEVEEERPRRGRRPRLVIVPSQDEEREVQSAQDFSDSVETETVEDSSSQDESMPTQETEAEVINNE